MAKTDVGQFCPLLQKKCVGTRCAWFSHVRGANPQTGNETDTSACAIALIPLLSINIAKEVRQGAVATESFRNAVVGAAQEVQKNKALT